MSDDPHSEMLALLRELAEVLCEAGVDDWCQRCCKLIDSNWHPSVIATSVRGWYGGMGSLNDLRLDSAGNQEHFERVTSRLYEVICNFLRAVDE